MKLSTDTKIELQHAMIRAEEFRNHHMNQQGIALKYMELAQTEETMAKFYRIAKYHGERAEHYQKVSEDFRRVLFNHEQY